jgi:hypothetical protein
MFFKKSNPKCNKCGIENCANTYECKNRVVKAVTNSLRPLSAEKLYKLITAYNHIGKTIKLLKLNFSYEISPDVGIYSPLNNYSFYGIIGVNYPVNWGDEIIEAPIWIKVVGELVFNDSWFVSDNQSVTNIYQRGELYYTSELNCMCLTLRAKEEHENTVVELITRGFLGSESYPNLCCEFVLPDNMESASKRNGVAVKNWEIGNMFYARQGYNMDLFEGPDGCL